MQNGLTGLVETPSAFHQTDADVAVAFSFDPDVRSVAIAFQALPWLETSLAFTTFDDIGGGVSEQTRSLNLKARLFSEGQYLPAVSLGINNLFSNDRSSAEYIVASKSFGDSFRANLGVGWGRLGGYDTAADVFGDRPQPGTANRADFDHLFQGSAALFGGIAWDTPIDRLTLAAEYSSASVSGTAASPESRVNFAANYRLTDGVDFVAFSRNGTTTGIGLRFSANAKAPPAPLNLGNVPPLITPRPSEGRTVTGWAANDQYTDQLRRATANALAASSVRLDRFAARGTTIRVGITALQSTPIPQAIGRTVRVLTELAPPSVTEFQITTFLMGLPGTTVTIPRDNITALADRPGRGPDSFALAQIEGATPSETGWDWSAPPPLGFSWSLTPSLSLPLDEEGEIAPELSVFANARYDVSRTFYVAGTLSYLLAGDRDITPAPATPTARSDTGTYNRDSLRLDRLYGTHTSKVSKTVYSGLSFGLLERQYRGVSAEALWIPDDRNWALGAELTYAQKRDYEDPFGALDFEAVTGFLSVHWDTGFEGLSARVDAGRYLAGDWGTTVALSRSFASGWEVTSYATLTEDNRDENLKIGTSVSIPLSTLGSPRSNRRQVLSLGGNFGDAGARVAVPDRLMGRVKDARSQRTEDAWSEFWN